MSAGFAAGEEQWRARLGTLRQVVRQELVARQVAAHLPDLPARRVLDVGCGQGTQALLLARRGHRVTGLDSSVPLLGDFRAALAAEPAPVRDRVRLVQGDAEAAAALFAPSSFDAVLCHGVLMYFPDPGPLLDAIARVAAPGGVVSLLVRNGDALAMRPGLLGDWDGAGQAFDGDGYRNRIGVSARADRLDDLTAALAARQLAVTRWYGVRVFTDTAASDAPLPGPAALDALLRAEEQAGRTDPYRHVAALLHLVAVRGREPALSLPGRRPGERVPGDDRAAGHDRGPGRPAVPGPAHPHALVILVAQLAPEHDTGLRVEAAQVLQRNGHLGQLRDRAQGGVRGQLGDLADVVAQRRRQRGRRPVDTARPAQHLRQHQSRRSGARAQARLPDPHRRVVGFEHLGVGPEDRHRHLSA